MFSSGFVVCVLKNSRPCEESKQGVVRLPFGEEYAIRLRNKSKRDAVATIFLDGENVSGNGYIVRAGEWNDIERHFDSSTKFRFVSAESEAAIDAGKNSAVDDRNGVIEVRWRTEEEPQPVVRHHYVSPLWIDGYYPPNPRRTPPIWSDRFGVTCDSSGLVSRSMSAKSLNASSPHCEVRAWDVNTQLSEGCTVAGSSSSQRFVTGRIGPLVPEGDAVVIRIVLKGFNAPGPYKFARGDGQVKQGIECEVGKTYETTFGKGGKITAHKELMPMTGFCGECGHNRSLDSKPTKFCVVCGHKF